MADFRGKGPVGLWDVQSGIEEICSKAYLYRSCFLRPEHFMVPLDEGCGRTTLLRHMAERYKDAGVLGFDCGLDDFLEIVFDGTPVQMRNAFSVIGSAAVYKNNYENIIGMDISRVAMHLGEAWCNEFLNNCKAVCEHASVVFFVRAEPSRNEERLMEKLQNAIDHIRRFDAQAYTQSELCEIIIRFFDEHYVVVEQEEKFRETLRVAVEETGIVNAKEACHLASALTRLAEFSEGRAVVNEAVLKAFLANDISTFTKGRLAG